MNKEEILEDSIQEKEYYFNDREKEFVLNCMQAYADQEVAQQTATLQQELDRLKNPWVKCSERLPEENRFVLFLKHYGTAQDSEYADGWVSKGKCFIAGHIEIKDFTHWCELPEPPQQ